MTNTFYSKQPASLLTINMINLVYNAAQSKR